MKVRVTKKAYYQEKLLSVGAEIDFKGEALPSWAEEIKNGEAPPKGQSKKKEGNAPTTLHDMAKGKKPNLTRPGGRERHGK